MIIDLRKHGAALVRWLEDPAGETFLEYLDEIEEVKMNELRKSRDLLDIGRCQGALEILRKLKDLKGDCQEALKRGHN